MPKLILLLYKALVQEGAVLWKGLVYHLTATWVHFLQFGSSEVEEGEYMNGFY